MRTYLTASVVLFVAILTGCATSRTGPEMTVATKPEPPPLQVRCHTGTPDVLKEIAEYYQSLNVKYDQPWPQPSDPIQDKRQDDNLTDCSGMFYRVAWKFSRTCPGYDLPTPKSHRKVKDAAAWYAQKDLLTEITDPIKQSHLIKPGMVMFYGKERKRYAPQELSSPEAVAEKGFHMGIVVDVQRDEGELSRYSLFHGRSGTKPAKITSYHVRKPRSNPDYPFGNGAEQWIGITPFVDGSTP